MGANLRPGAGTYGYNALVGSLPRSAAMNKSSHQSNAGESVDRAIYGKAKAKKDGVAPAIALVNPKFPHNVGKAVRAASCFGVKQVWFTGDRVSLKLPGKKGRLPREERMKGYKDVELRHFDSFFDEFPRDVVPVAVELRADAENLLTFEHPEKALYVFGPEDGSLEKAQVRHCHRFVVIPTRHCVNLGAAVYLVLYDRMYKRCMAGLEPILPITEALREQRGWAEPEEVVYAT
jgi:tRNA(Leu) C34 or U34 (ribose-2'-O)-methylase TrmL